MTEKLLNRAQITSSLKQVRGKTRVKMLRITRWDRERFKMMLQLLF
ncbi:MAG: hypothetical protein H7A51_00370 [Akkermansiaceae bacterium]|nr:hypothetical protein [Akkermansiaceae bacterium]